LGSVAATIAATKERAIRAAEVTPRELKRRTARGALVSTGAQMATFALRTTSLMVLARLLMKEDFGLVSMVTAFTGVLGLLRDSLSMATVQRLDITEAQMSTLFWINLGVGGLLAVAAAAAAPILVVFYGEPRLLWMTVAVATVLAVNGAAAQHRAMLQRSMRFGTLACIDTVALASGIGVGIAMALAGTGYWALVGMAIVQPVVSASGAWATAGWIPGRPRRESETRSMLAFGGAVTANNVLGYLAFNLDKILIGRVWGAEILGVYSRAYQLINLSNENLLTSIGSVAFPALSRVQNDLPRLRAYFLRGYGLFLSLVVPVTIGCALFADDIVLVLLGPKWHEATTIFRMLAPTILAIGCINPFAWLLLASGRAGRCVRIALMVTTALILAYAVAIGHGPVAMAMALSGTMLVLVLPAVAWAREGTPISMLDVFRTLRPVATAIIVAAAVTWLARPVLGEMEPGLARLVAECSILFGAYLLCMAFVMRQWAVYASLARDLGLLRAV
jgi:O-antigen/teichoic acid export membrane protein